MAVKSAQQAVQNWQQGIAQGGAKYAAGINAVTESPMAAAAAQQDKMLANVTQAVTSGRWANALNNTSMAFWKTQAANAQSKWSAGAQKGLTKFTASAQKMQGVWQAAQNAAKAAGSDPVARFTAAMQVMQAAGKKGQQG